MRILAFIDSLGAGGAQRQLVALAVGLVRLGHQVELAVYHQEPTFFLQSLVDSDIPVHHLVRGRRISADVIFALRRLCSERTFDIVVSFLDAPNMYAELALLGQFSPRLVVSERNSYEKGKPSLTKYLLDSLHRCADAVTVNTYYQARQLTKAIPSLTHKTHIIYNGIDLYAFCPHRNPALPTDSFLCVGSVVPRKNICTLINALDIYRNRYGHAPTVNWVGTAQHTQESAGEYAHALELLQQLDLTDNWIWLGEQSNMPAIYNSFSSFIHPSLREGLPNAVCEAMASGLPPLVSNIGENAKIVEEGVSGFYFDPTSPKSIAEVIRIYLTAPDDLKARMGAAARQFAERNFSLPTYAVNYEALFHSIL